MVNPEWGSFETPEDVNRKVYENRNNFESIPFAEEEEIEEFQGEITDSSESEGNKPQWGDFDSPETYQGEPDPTEDEDTIGYFVRNIARGASRIGEQLVGKYGNIEKMGKDFISNVPISSGLLGYGLQKLIGQERWEQLVKGRPGQQQMLPTSEQLKEMSEEITGGYTRAKTSKEEKIDKYIEDIGSTLGGNRAVNLRNVAVNNLGIPVASNVVQNVIEDLGFGKDKAMVGKLGAWTALSLLGNVNAPRYASDLTNQGRNGIPQNLNYNTPRMMQRLDQVERSLLTSDPRTSLAREQIANIRRDIASGQNSTRSLMTMYDGTNAAKRNRGLFELNRNDRNFARGSIDRVLHAVRDEIMESGSNYPQALESWRNGIQAWAVIHQSKAITNTIDSWARGPYAKVLGGPALGLFGVSGYSALKAPIVAAPASVAVPAAYKTLQTAYRTWQDPRLSQYYWNAILDAQRENAPAFINNYNKLNKQLEKSSSSSKVNKKRA